MNDIERRAHFEAWLNQKYNVAVHDVEAHGVLWDEEDQRYQTLWIQAAWEAFNAGVGLDPVRTTGPKGPTGSGSAAAKAPK